MVGTWRKFSNFVHPVPLTENFPGEAALIDGNFKLYKTGDSVELYDLAADAAEADNITGSQQEVTKKMLAELNRWQASVEQSLSGNDYDDSPTSTDDGPTGDNRR